MRSDGPGCTFTLRGIPIGVWSEATTLGNVDVAQQRSEQAAPRGTRKRPPDGCRGIPAIVPSNQLTFESSLPTQSTKRLFKIAQCLLCSGRLGEISPLSVGNTPGCDS